MLTRLRSSSFTAASVRSGSPRARKGTVANARTQPSNDRQRRFAFGCAANVISHVWSDRPIQSKLNGPRERREGSTSMSDIVLWGFDGSTYVRTVKMVLAEKGVTEYKQVPLNVLKGDPKTPEHRERHPFGKVPVLDHDGARILETTAIARYLNDVLPGKSLIPSTPKDRARMDMVIGLIDSYGYGALIGGVAAYHLFPDFVGGKNDAMRENGLENGRKMIELAMKTKGSSPFIAGDLSLADLYLAPIAFYVSLTSDKDALFNVPGFADWWTKMQALPSYKDTQPNLG
jgi:glutathione S-transferase